MPTSPLMDNIGKSLSITSISQSSRLSGATQLSNLELNILMKVIFYSTLPFFHVRLFPLSEEYQYLLIRLAL
jgi:hypothetical protein